MDLLDQRQRIAHKLGSAVGIERVTDVEQVVGNAGLFLHAGLGRSDVHTAVDEGGIDTDDLYRPLAGQLLGQRNGGAGFAGVRLGSNHQRTQEEKTTSAKRLGNKLFFPALAIPVVTVIGVLLFNNLPSWQVALFGPGNHATLITLFSMTVGTLIGLAMAIRMTHETVAQPMQEARRLLDSVGWAFILPQILAVLGLLFTAAGVGTSISWLTEHYLAVDNRFIAVAVYAIGMAVLTMVMGNAFAAFPIVTAGVGIPILVLQHGGNPAVMAAIGHQEPDRH